MTYNSFLDFYFSTKWLSISFPFFLILVTIILLQAYEYKSKWKKGLVIALFPLAFIILLTTGSFNPMWLGYGKPIGIMSVHRMDGQLLVLDYLRTAGGKSSRGVEYYRVHVLNPADGSKKIRFTVGTKGELIGLAGDTLVFAQYQNVSFYSLSSGKKIKEWTIETLPALFPELANGVFQFDFRNKEAYATATDGTKWILHPLSQTIQAEKDYKEPSYIPSYNFYVKDSYVYYDNKRWGTEVLELKTMKGNDLLKFITKDDSICNKELSFLNGDFIGMSNKNNCLLIKHYNSTDKTGSAYTAVSLDGKTLLWELKSSDSLPELSYNLAIDEDAGLFFFSCKNEVLCAGLKDGKILWRRGL